MSIHAISGARYCSAFFFSAFITDYPCPNLESDCLNKESVRLIAYLYRGSGMPKRK